MNKEALITFTSFLILNNLTNSSGKGVVENTSTGQSLRIFTQPFRNELNVKVEEENYKLIKTSFGWALTTNYGKPLVDFTLAATSRETLAVELVSGRIYKSTLNGMTLSSVDEITNEAVPVAVSSQSYL